MKFRVRELTRYKGHRDYGVACVQDSKGEIRDEFRFGNDIEGISKSKKSWGTIIHISQ